jgi:beta-galactosidase GanA
VKLSETNLRYRVARLGTVVAQHLTWVRTRALAHNTVKCGVVPQVLLLSGSVHYPRSTPAMWPSIFEKMKKNGLNCVESYVFWNFHVRSAADRTSPDYSGRGNVTLFLELAAAADLFVIWRIGPYINAEWYGGGFPDWLKAMPGVKVQTATQPYMRETEQWMQSHVDTIRPFLAGNGGPIILCQMDNELGGASAACVDTIWCCLCSDAKSQQMLLVSAVTRTLSWINPSFGSPFHLLRYDTTRK